MYVEKFASGVKTMKHLVKFSLLYDCTENILQARQSGTTTGGPLADFLTIKWFSWLVLVAKSGVERSPPGRRVIFPGKGGGERGPRN